MFCIMDGTIHYRCCNTQMFYLFIYFAVCLYSLGALINIKIFLFFVIPVLYIYIRSDAIQAAIIKELNSSKTNENIKYNDDRNIRMNHLDRLYN